MKPLPTEPTDLQAMEAAAAEHLGARYLLRLFVAGPTSQSTRAVVNTRKLCEEHLEGRYDLEVVDISQSPEDARNAQIVAVPTLVKVLPLPLRRFVGDMSDTTRILTRMGLEAQDGSLTSI